MATKKSTGKDGMQDVCTVLSDGTRTNADLMASLLENPKKESRLERRERLDLYRRELGLTEEELKNFA